MNRTNILYISLDHPNSFEIQSEMKQLFKMIFYEENDKNPKDQYGNTPFHHAAKYGLSEICHLIINLVDDKNPKDIDKTTPLHMAAKNGHSNIFQSILNLSVHHRNC